MRDFIGLALFFQVFIGLALFFQVSKAAIDADLVPSLPNFGPTLTKTYSGYLAIDNGKYLHYMYIESLTNPKESPLTAWFNGGPGCSSLEG